MKTIKRILRKILLRARGEILSLTFKGKIISGVVIVLIAGSLFGAFEIGSSVRQPEESIPTLGNIPMHTPLPAVPLLTFQQSLAMNSFPTDQRTLPSRCPALPNNWVALENSRTSSDVNMKEFKTSHTPWPEGSALWLDKTSVTCGDTVSIHASSAKFSNGLLSKYPRKFEVIRIGWYGGSGGYVVWKSSPISLKYFPTPNPKDNLRTIETKWPAVTSFHIDNSWVPGFYLVASYSSDGYLESCAPLILRAPAGAAPLALIHSTLTWNTYNTFGGRSGYIGPGLSHEQMSYERSRVVSMDRPLAGSGNELLFRDAVPLVEFAEENGIALSQYSDVDLNEMPSLLKQYNGIVFSGHPEYWTQRNHDAIIAARNSGINLAFLGGNTAYWRVRMAPSPLGPDRHIVIWRDSREDPAKVQSDATLQYSSSIINQPSTLIGGSMTSGLGVYGDLKSQHLPSWIGVPSGITLKGFSRYTEIEAPVSGPASPPLVHPLFVGKFTFPGNPNDQEPRYRNNDVAEMDWFSVPSGAAILNAGVNLWDCNLEPSCGMGTVDWVTQQNMQIITSRILQMFAQKGVAQKLLS